MPINPLPKPRADLQARRVGDEIVIVCERTGQAHMLTGDQVTVWDALNTGRESSTPDDVTAAVVAEFAALDLVELPAGLDRRTVLQRGAVVGGVGIMTLALGELPAYASVNVPTTLTLASPNTNPAPSTGITLTATLKRGNGNLDPIANASIVLKDGSGATVGSGTTNASGIASIAYTTPAAGQQVKLTASYAGSSTYTGQTSNTVTEYVTTLSASPASGSKGATNNITLNGAGFAAGTVTFTINTSDSVAPNTTVASATAPVGSFSQATVIVAGNGKHTDTVTATDSLGNTATVAILMQ